jgi:hypothetical protein
MCQLSLWGPILIGILLFYTLTTTGTYMSVPYPCGADADYHHVPYMVYP